MTETLLFSIIIPTYNRGRFLYKTIESVLTQTYTHFELIIVDDGSTDDTESVVAGFKDKRIIYHFKINEERGVARNTGMDLAIGNYITFLDSDDILYPNHLQNAFKRIKDFSYPDFYRQAYEIKNEKGLVLFANNKLRGDANKFILKGNYFSCIGVFLTKQVTNEVRFNTDRRICPSEDWDYWLRLSVRYKFYYDNAVTASMLQHDERSLNNFNEKQSKLAIALLIKSLKKDEVFVKKRGKYLNMIMAQMYSLLCLNKVLHKKQNGLIKVVIKTLKLSKRELFRRRSLAIIKYYLLNLLH